MNASPIIRGSLILALAGQGLPADTLTVGGAVGAPGAAVTLPFRFANTRQIVGAQFDLVFPATQVTAGGALAASASTNHQAQSRELSPGRRRIVVYSTTNQLLPNDLFLQVPLSLTDTIPAGGPTVSVANLVLTDRQGRTFTPTLRFPKLDEWRKTFFTDAELTDPEIVGDDRDPDGDGVVNLAEYVAGTSPVAANSAAAPQSGETTVDGITYLTMKWKQEVTADAAEPQVEASSDLASWGTVEGAEPTGVIDGSLVEWQVAVSMSPDGRQFLRLNFRRTSP